MKKFFKIFLSICLAAVLALSALVGCGETENPGGNQGENPGGNQGENPGGSQGGEETVDYVSQLHLDMTSETKKQEVTVRLYIDGDTTHFDPVSNSSLTPYNPADFAGTQGYIKARYLAVDTPESTGDIEKWGKTASNFTKEKLSGAEKIIVESDDGVWNIDSTGERYTLWIWYKPAGEEEYRNLNVEILQNGFAYASSTASNRYGEIASAALDQARAQKLHVYAPDSVKDENFYEGEAIAIDLKTLRYHMNDYVQKSVRVEGVVIAVYDHSAYIEQYDEETDLYFGMAVYYGFKTGAIQDVLSVGNLVNVVGSITEFSGTYQISGVSANKIRPSDTDSRIISKGHDAAFKETTASNIVSGRLEASFEVKGEDGVETVETKEIAYGEAIMSTSVSVRGLTVESAYTTHNGGDNEGAISLTCRAADGTRITVRTTVLTENGVLVTQDRYLGKTIDVKGLVDYYNGEYQVKVHRVDYITIVG